MSYEGITWNICKNGHLVNCDSMSLMYDDDYKKENDKCYICNSPFVWVYDEDVTNGIDSNNPMNNNEIKKFIKNPAVYRPVLVIDADTKQVYQEAIRLIKEEEYNIPDTFGKKL